MITSGCPGEEDRSKGEWMGLGKFASHMLNVSLLHRAAEIGPRVDDGTAPVAVEVVLPRNELPALWAKEVPVAVTGKQHDDQMKMPPHPSSTFSIRVMHSKMLICGAEGGRGDGRILTR
jgi:hypothetical protein